MGLSIFFFLFSHWVIYENKGFSNGHWDTLALKNILFKKETFKEIYSINGLLFNDSSQFV